MSGADSTFLHAKLIAQLCSTCFSTFVGTQHVLQMIGYGVTSASRSVPTLGSQRSQRHGHHHPSSTNTTRSTIHSINLLEAPPPRPPRERASPSTRILRAACFSEMAFSITGAVTTGFLIHDPSLRSSFLLMFWAQAPHWCTQIASFCWMGTLAMYIAKRNRANFDVAIAHAVIWMIAVFYWVLELYAVYYKKRLYVDLAMILWMIFASVNFVIVGACWGIFAMRWKRRHGAQRGLFVISKLFSYTIAFCACVFPIVLVDIIDGIYSTGTMHDVSSVLLALWPTANAIVYITKPTLCFRWFQDRSDRQAARGVDTPGVHGSVGLSVGQLLPGDLLRRNGGHPTPLLLSPTQNELKGLEIGEKIGEGIAVVYKGKWRGISVAVKMKSLMIDRSEDLVEFQRECNLEIQQEAVVMKTLCHPNIVLFMEAGFYKGSICIVSEYCARGSLRDVLMRSNVKHLSWSTKLRLALGIAHGIQYLHNAKPPMIHRDLKSPNVLVDDSWHAKIADFGTLRFAEIVSSVQNSQSRVRGTTTSNTHQEATVMTGLVGTTRWMAPEVIRGDKYYTHKVDIYSLGLIFWELIDGQLPFASTRWNHEIEQYVLKDLRPPVPSELCPQRWELLIMTCWQSDPAQRPTIQQVISNLQRIAREETLDTTAPRFTGMSQMSLTQSTVSNTSFLNASMVSMRSQTSSTSSPTSSFRANKSRVKHGRNRTTFGLDASYMSVEEEGVEFREDYQIGSERTVTGEYYAETSPYHPRRDGPSSHFIDSHAVEDTIPELPLPYDKTLSGDQSAMISI